MAAQTNTKKQIGEEGVVIEETSSHPIIQELVKIEDLISQGSDEETIMKAVKGYSENLTSPGFLNEAEKGVVALARKRIEEILTKHEKVLLLEAKGRPIRGELVKAKAKLTEHIGHKEEIIDLGEYQEGAKKLKELDYKFDHAMTEDNVFAADIFWQDIYKLDPKHAEDLKPLLDDLKKEVVQVPEVTPSTPAPESVSLAPSAPEAQPGPKGTTTVSTTVSPSASFATTTSPSGMPVVAPPSAPPIAPVVAPVPTPTTPPAPSGAPSTQSGAPPRPREPETAEGEEAETNLKLSKKARELLETLLEKKELIRDDDAVCLAINALIQQSDVDLDQLKQFLQNTELLNKTISPEVRNRVKAEMDLAKVTTYENFKKALNDELKTVEYTLDSLSKQQRPSDADKAERKQNLTRRIEIERLLEHADNLNKLEKRTMTYESPREILNLINFYLHKDEPELKMEDLMSQTEELVEEQKENLYKGPRAVLNKFCSFLRPTLKSTLKALAEDKKFSKLGENAGEELAKLSQLKVVNDQFKVKEWIEGLPGDYKEHMETTVPRLIAYLELAIRDGKVSSLLQTGPARKLVENLRKLQREHIRLSIKDQPIDNQQKMLLYVSEINKASRKNTDITGEVLRKRLHLGRNEALKILGGTGALAGALTMAAISPFALFGGLSTALYATVRRSKKIPEKWKPLARAATGRLAVANGLVVGGSLIGITSLYLPLAAAIGVVAVPWLWKRRKAKKGAKKE